MTRWTRQDPGAGDTAVIRTAAVNVEYAAAGLAQAARSLSDDGDTADQPSLWAGAACDAWRGERDQLDRDLGDVVEALQEHHDALTAYADEVEDIAGWAERARTRRADAEQDRADARREMYALPDPGVTFALSGRPKTTPAARIALAEKDIVGADAALGELADRRGLADRTVTAALVPVAVGDWAELGRTMAAAGFERPDQMDEVALAGAIADAMRGSDLAGLAALLAVWGDSPAVLGTALRRVGGEGLVDLLGRLDRQALHDPRDAAAVTEVQDALRRALAVGSSAWDRVTATEFAASMLRGENAALAVAFLFGDPVGAAVAPTLVLGMADALQAYEERHGRPPVEYQDGFGAGGQMAAAIAAQQGLGPVFMLDPADAVFRQMVRHPQAALDWLADDAAGPGRIAHWFGERDWTVGLGYAAPMLVWESLQTIPGALVGPGMDEALAERLAGVNAGIVTRLMKGDHLPAQGLDPEALLALAGVLERQLPIWLETVILRGDAFEAAESRKIEVLWLGADRAGPSARIEKYWLDGLLSRVAGDDRAAGYLLGAVERLQGRLVASAGSSGLTHVELAERCAELLGVVDRARLARELADAARSDELAANGLSVGGLFLGEVLGTAGPAGSVAATIAEDAALARWANEYQRRLDEFHAGGGAAGERRDQARSVLGSMVDAGWIPVAEIERLGGREHVLALLLDRYVDERGR